ncbi:hypothetical protein BKA93DRAFT_117124 [Sparassis latifolia]
MTQYMQEGETPIGTQRSGARVCQCGRDAMRMMRIWIWRNGERKGCSPTPSAWRVMRACTWGPGTPKGATGKYLHMLPSGRLVSPPSSCMRREPSARGNAPRSQIPRRRQKFHRQRASTGRLAKSTEGGSLASCMEARASMFSRRVTRHWPYIVYGQHERERKTFIKPSMEETGIAGKTWQWRSEKAAARR